MERIIWTKEKSESYLNVVEKMHEIVGPLSKTYDAVFIELQRAFTDVCKKAPARYWIWDGIHPMPAGHELIARIWIKDVMGKLDLTGNGY
jgi:lysophospholipase L1-like esterase